MALTSTRLVAFLRAINVGGHIVSMETLRTHFEKMGFGDVETFIASGNVIFSAGTKNVATVEQKIESHLKKVLGYEVKTFVRTGAEVAAVAAHKAFGDAEHKNARAFNIGFLRAPLGSAGIKAVQALTTDCDAFHLHNREIYWLCKVSQSDSRFTNVKFEKLAGTSATFRGINTLTRLVAKHGFSV